MSEGSSRQQQQTHPRRVLRDLERARSRRVHLQRNVLAAICVIIGIHSCAISASSRSTKHVEPLALNLEDAIAILESPEAGADLREAASVGAANRAYQGLRAMEDPGSSWIAERNRHRLNSIARAIEAEISK